MVLLLLTACHDPKGAAERTDGAETAPDADSADSGADTAPPVEASPVLLLVTLDTLRGDHVGVETPFLSELAAEGLELRDLDAHSWTYPGVGAVITGLHPAEWGIESWTFSPTPDDMPYDFSTEIPTLAELLAARGWATAYWNSNGIAGSKSGFDRGYELAAEYAEGQTSEQARGMAAWLAANRDRPRFLHLHVNDPHSPYGLTSETCAAEVEALDAGVCRWDFIDSNEDSLFANDAVRDGDFTPESEDYDACRAVLAAAYACEVRFQDEELRVVWDTLSADGDLDEALSVFVVDHGEGLLDPWTNHGFDLRMPVLDGWGLVHWPGRVDPGVNTLPTSQEDILPTIAELLAIDFGIPFSGFPVQDVPADRVRTSFFGGQIPSIPAWGSVYSAHDQRHHHIADTFGGCALYDLASDPGERTNLCGAEPVPEHLSEAITALREQTAGYDAPPNPPEAAR